jgi:hypothetical protein
MQCCLIINCAIPEGKEAKANLVDVVTKLLEKKEGENFRSGWSFESEMKD